VYVRPGDASSDAFGWIGGGTGERPGSVCRGTCGCIEGPPGRGGANDGRGATAEDDTGGAAFVASSLGLSGSLIEIAAAGERRPPTLPAIAKIGPKQKPGSRPNEPCPASVRGRTV
jgi:hypothetical protein